MATHAIAHFQNDAGHAVIEIGVKEFMCVGANPPFDHPHVFIDLGADSRRSAPIARRFSAIIPRCTVTRHCRQAALTMTRRRESREAL